MLRPVTGPLTPPEAPPVQRPPAAPAAPARSAAPAAPQDPEPSAPPAVRAASSFDPTQVAFGRDEVIQTAPPRLEGSVSSREGYRPPLVSVEEVTATGQQFLMRDQQAREQNPASAAQGPADITLEHDVPAFTERLQDQLNEVTEAYSADPSPANRGRLRDASVAYNTWARFLSDHPQLETPMVTNARTRREPVLFDRVAAVRENQLLPPLPGGPPVPDSPTHPDGDFGVSAALQDRERVTTTADGNRTAQRETTYGIGLSAARDRTSVGVGIRYSSTATEEEGQSRLEGDLRFSRPGVDITLGYREGTGVSLTSPGWVIPLPGTDGRFGVQPSLFSNPVDQHPLDPTFRGMTGDSADRSPFQGSGLRLDLVRRF